MQGRCRRRQQVVVAALTAVIAIAGAGTAVAQEPIGASQAVVRDGNQWLLAEAPGEPVASQSFRYGSPGDSNFVTGDWNGDGVRTPGIIRPDAARGELVWYLRNQNSSGVADASLRFGAVLGPESFDTPIVGDWDGDGVETVGVVRPDYDRNVFVWRLKNDLESGPAEVEFTYGRPYRYGQFDPLERRGIPVTGDWDGDGTTTVGVVVGSIREGGALRWLLTNTNAGGRAEVELRYGSASDTPLAGDWDGDGTTTPGVWRLPNQWLLRNALTSGVADLSFRYGKLSDLPVVWGTANAGAAAETGAVS